MPINRIKILLCFPVNEPLMAQISFLIQIMQWQTEIAYINFEAFEGNLQELEHVQTDLQTDFVSTFPF